MLLSLLAWLEIQYSMRFDLQAQIYINCGFAKINYLVLNIAVHFYKESNELKSLVLCSPADFYSENMQIYCEYISKAKRSKLYTAYIELY
jgi:hypothetical protein